jgi:hypothetical protein
MLQKAETFCLFVGYPRSGHSLVGSLLDAHPEVALAHEADVLKYFEDGHTRPRIFKELLANSRRQADRETGRTQSGYIYDIPGQWQGRVARLRVIGDKSGGETVRRLAANPSQLRRFADFIELPLRLIHVVRNPFDTVARLSLVTNNDLPKRTIGEAVTWFEVYATVNAALIESGEFDILTLRHEEVVADPRANLRRACEFVGVEPFDEYVEACAGIVWDAPHRTRDRIDWPERELDRVSRIAERYDFLRSYSFA